MSWQLALLCLSIASGSLGQYREPTEEELQSSDLDQLPPQYPDYFHYQQSAPQGYKFVEYIYEDDDDGLIRNDLAANRQRGDEDYKADEDTNGLIIRKKRSWGWGGGGGGGRRRGGFRRRGGRRRGGGRRHKKVVVVVAKPVYYGGGGGGCGYGGCGGGGGGYGWK